MHTRKLDDSERALIIRTNTPNLTRGGWGHKEGQAVFVSESGLYKLIMRPEKPDAVAFQNWVTKEVLPSIRKTGGYLLNEAARTTAHADTKEAMPKDH